MVSDKEGKYSRQGPKLVPGGKVFLAKEMERECLKGLGQDVWCGEVGRARGREVCSSEQRAALPGKQWPGHYSLPSRHSQVSRQERSSLTTPVID